MTTILIAAAIWLTGFIAAAVITRTDPIAPSTAFPAKDDDWFDLLISGPIGGLFGLLMTPAQIFEPKKTKTKP